MIRSYGYLLNLVIREKIHMMSIMKSREPYTVYITWLYYYYSHLTAHREVSNDLRCFEKVHDLFTSTQYVSHFLIHFPILNSYSKNTLCNFCDFKRITQCNMLCSHYQSPDTLICIIIHTYLLSGSVSSNGEVNL